jgi:hypothetical protein
MLTKQQVEMAVPANLKSSVTQEMVDILNGIASEPSVGEAIRDNFISYTGVLRDGKFKTTDYLFAVTYVSYKLMGRTNKEAYALTFPQRYADLMAKGYSEKDISAFVSAYNKGKLVNLILEQTLVPTWVLNADIYQKAINTQAELMVTSSSDMVRMQAANSILTHLKKPDAAGPLINLDMRESSGMNELKDMLRNIATKQQSAIESGVSTADIAAQPLIEGKVIGRGTDQAEPG